MNQNDPVTRADIRQTRVIEREPFRFTVDMLDDSGFVRCEVWDDSDTTHYDAHGNTWHGRYVDADPEGNLPDHLTTGRDEIAFVSFVNLWLQKYAEQEERG
jgi:hypothetical protein